MLQPYSLQMATSNQIIFFIQSLTFGSGFVSLGHPLTESIWLR